MYPLECRSTKRREVEPQQCPALPGESHYLLLFISSRSTARTGKKSNTHSDDSWQADYAAYLAEKEAASAAQSNHKGPASEETWEVQYAAYCAEKEARLDRAEREATLDR